MICTSIFLLPHKGQQRGSLDSIERSVPDDVDEIGSGDKQIRTTDPIPSIPNDPKATKLKGTKRPMPIATKPWRFRFSLNIRVDISKGS